MSESAKLKSLDRPAGCLVILAPAFRKLERIAEDPADAGRIMPGNGQTAALFGAVQGECANDHMTARAHGLLDAVGIGELVCWIGEKVKCRAVVPHVIHAGRSPYCHIGDDPVHAGGSAGQPGFRDSESFF